MSLNSNDEELLSLIVSRFSYSDLLGGLVYKCWYNGLPKSKVGTRVGYKNPRGYRVVKVSNISYREHQLVWLMFNKELIIGGDVCIDHKDRDPNNCRIDNLRKVTQRINTRNRSNTSPFGSNIFLTSSGSFYVYVSFGGRRIGLWTHKTLKEAESVLNYYKSLGEESEHTALLTREKFRRVRNGV